VTYYNIFNGVIHDKNDFNLLTSSGQGHSKSNRLVPRLCPTTVKFHKDLISSFCVILLTDSQTQVII